MTTSRFALTYLPSLAGAGVLLTLILAQGAEDRTDWSQPRWHANIPIPEESLPSRPVSDNPVECYLAGNMERARLGHVAFCSIDSLGSSERDDTVFLYLWALVIAFDSASDEKSLNEGSGSSVPVVVKELATGDSLTILGHWEPQDGEYYGPSIRKMFPKKYVHFVLRYEDIGKGDSLLRDLHLKVRRYFGIHD